MSIFNNILGKPFGWILKGISALCGGNFALALLLFTLLINLALLPLSIKSQKANSQQIRIKPKMDAIRSKYANDKNRQNQEMSKLYQEEGISSAGGCVPMLIRMVVLMAIFYVIIAPLSNIVGVPSDLIDTANTNLTTLTESGEIDVSSRGAYYKELNILDNWEVLGSEGQQIKAMQEEHLDLTLFGQNLTNTPHFSWDIFHNFEVIWLIPILSFAAAIATSLVSMIQQKRLNPDAPNMAGMMLLMPLFSLWLAFQVPAAVGLYWIYSNVISGGLQIAVSHIYSPYKIIAGDHAKATLKRRAEEQAKIAAAADNSAGH